MSLSDIFFLKKGDVLRSISKTVFFLIFILTKIMGQNFEETNSIIYTDFGIGNSLYDDIKSEQLIIFLEIPKLSSQFSGIDIDYKINLEYINSNANGTFLAGVVPFARYSLFINQLSIFFQGGIGFNYINNHNIGSRNLGGHFIFSDMIGMGVDLFVITGHQVSLGYIFRHISNAGLYKDNEGYNSQYLVIGMSI